MDPIQSLLGSSRGAALVTRLGFTPPPVLRRFEPGQPLLTGPALVGAASGGRLGAVATLLKEAGAEVVTDSVAGPLGGLIFDATGIRDAWQLGLLREFFAEPLRRLGPSGRVLVLGTPAEHTGSAAEAAAQRALQGFTRSLAKELRAGATAQLVLVEPGAEARVESTLRFFLSARSAFVDGQLVRVGGQVETDDTSTDWDQPLAGRTVVVTGAARGIGAAMVSAFAQDGARVLGVDVAMLAGDLERVTRQAGGSHLVADVTAPDAAARIAAAAGPGGVHGLVHNAGITRDRKLVNLDQAGWQQVIAVNLLAPQRITAELLAGGTLRRGSRVLAISSVSGIAGNVGQTSYAASKAGLIGLVEALAPRLASDGIAINALAPGFIETAMTGRIPWVIREGGRRLSSLRQGGQPQDVAQAASWLLWPASAGITGNLIRVCGQALIGA